MAHWANLFGDTFPVDRAEPHGTVVRCILENPGKTLKDEC
jgi:hypothetical protein